MKFFCFSSALGDVSQKIYLNSTFLRCTDSQLPIPNPSTIINLLQARPMERQTINKWNKLYKILNGMKMTFLLTLDPALALLLCRYGSVRTIESEKFILAFVPSGCLDMLLIIKGVLYVKYIHYNYFVT